MPFDPSQPYEPVDSGFDPNKPFTTVEEGQPANTSAPVLAQQQTQESSAYYRQLYKGIDKLNSKEFESLNTRQTADEDKAKAVNLVYLKKQLPNADLSQNYQTIKDTYANQALGMNVKNISDKDLYTAIGEHIGATGEQAKHWEALDELHKFTTEGEAAYAFNWLPSISLPSAPNLPDLPHLGLGNPAIIAGVYNGVVKPFVDFSASPEGIKMGAMGEIAEGSRIAMRGLAGLMGGAMTIDTVKNAPEVIKTLNDPNATKQDKIQVVSGAVANSLLALGGVLGAVMPEKGGIVKPEEFNNKTPQEAADMLRAKTVDAPMEQIMPLKAAAAKLEEFHTPESEVAKSWDEVKQILAPQTRGERAEYTAGSLREFGATLARNTNIAETALKDASSTVMKLDESARWDFVNRIETGSEQVSPDLQAAHTAIRNILDTSRDEVQGLGTGKLDSFIEDYFPHIWEDPEAAGKAFKQAESKRPLQGSKAFLKQRTIPTIQEGLQLGLKPVTDNPVELVLLKNREMQKYILANKWLAEMKEKDLVKFVRVGEVPPENFVKINDNISKVYGPPAKGGRVIYGEYYAPSDVGTVANNYLSPGLRGSSTFRGFLSMGNTLNQFQLGLSFFHAGFTSLDTAISKVSLGLEYGFEGKPGEAFKNIVTAPAAPVTTLIEGSKVHSEWMKPGSQGADYARIVEALQKGGARARMDEFYRTNTTKRMKQLFGEKTIKGFAGGLVRAPFAAIEQTAKPLMEYIVPRQKLGVAAELLRKELAKIPEGATDAQVRQLSAKVWDSVDNRMGQMVYDNLFWNKTAKDLAMASVRSVGWNLGTLREVGGGLVDTGKFLKDALTPKEKAEFTHRMGYVIAMPIVTGFIGATYQYMLTGEGPDEMKDYFFPKTGEKDNQGRDVRMSLPTYMKDVYHYGHDPVGTIEGKAHPLIGLSVQMLNNKDYYGRPIVNADDPLIEKMIDEANYFGKQVAPLGIKTSLQAQKAKETPLEQAGAFVGITRAPAYISESDAENLAAKLAGAKFKSGKELPGQQEMLDKKQQIQLALRSQDPAERNRGMGMLNAMVEKGELTSQQANNLRRGTTRDFLENQLIHLDAREALRVMKVATPDEKRAISQMVLRKVETARVPVQERQSLLNQYRTLLADRNVETSLR